MWSTILIGRCDITRRKSFENVVDFEENTVYVLQLDQKK